MIKIIDLILRTVVLEIVIYYLYLEEYRNLFKKIYGKCHFLLFEIN